MNPTIIIVDPRSIFTECLCEFLAASLPELKVLPISNAKQVNELTFLPVTCFLVSDSSDVPVVRRAFPSASLLLICDSQSSDINDPQLSKLMLDMPRNVFAEVVRCAARRGCDNALDVSRPSLEQGPTPNEIEPCSPKLSDRESEVLAALKRGLPNKLIADEMCLSENTVKIHVRNVMRKLGVTNRTMAALCETENTTRAVPSI